MHHNGGDMNLFIFNFVAFLILFGTFRLIMNLVGDGEEEGEKIENCFGTAFV